MSIRTRLSWAFVGIAFASLMVTSLIVYLAASTILRESIEQSHVALARAQKERVEDLLGAQRRTFHVAANRRSFRTRLADAAAGARPWEDVSTWVTEFTASQSHLASFHVVAADGTVVASNRAHRVGAPLPYALSKPNPGHDQPVRHLAAVLYDDTPEHRLVVGGRVTPNDARPDEHFLLLLEFDAREIAHALATTGRFGATGETVVGTRTRGEALSIGTTRFGPPDQPTVTTFAAGDRTPIAYVVRGHEGLLPSDTVDYRGVPVLAAGFRIAHTPWALAVKLDEAEAMAPLTRLVQWLLIVAAGGTVLAAFVGVAFARSMSRPLDLLTQAVRRDEPIPPAVTLRRDETGLLARALAERDAAHAEARTELGDTLSTLEDRVRERTEQLRVLAFEITQTEQRERRRLAEVLHDGLQQLLVAARLRLALIRPDTPADAVSTHCKSVDGLLNEAITASRSLSVELSPPVIYQGPFGDALNWLALQMQQRYAIEVDLHAEGEFPLDDTVRAFLFTAARELLFNVVKHAHTAQASLSVQQIDGQVEMEVADRGRGVEGAALCQKRPASLGLFSIRERANALGGDLTIDSQPGEGTCVRVRIPVAAAMAGEEADSPLKADAAKAITGSPVR